MTLPPRIAVIVSISVAACTDARGPATTGSYDLDVTAVDDTCDPGRPTGTFRASAFRVANALSLDVPFEGGSGSTVAQKIEVTPPDAPAVYTRDLTECSSGVYERTLRVSAETPNSIDATITERWRDVAGCPAEAVVPRASCEAERQLVYALALACEAPCVLVTEGDDVACRC